MIIPRLDDTYRTGAAHMFGVPYEAVTPEQRSEYKMRTFSKRWGRKMPTMTRPEADLAKTRASLASFVEAAMGQAMPVHLGYVAAALERIGRPPPAFVEYVPPRHLMSRTLAREFFGVGRGVEPGPVPRWDGSPAFPTLSLAELRRQFGLPARGGFPRLRAGLYAAAKALDPKGEADGAPASRRWTNSKARWRRRQRSKEKSL